MKPNKAKDKRKKVSPPTIGFMFIDQTPGGVLAKKLQEVEDRLATVSGYPIRMVELSGTQLQRLLPNTNPWSGHNCGRINCYTCDQVKRSYRTVRYSKCRIPQLVINQDDWQLFKKKEKAELEAKAVETVLEINEDWEETTIVLEEEVEFAIFENESKIEKKRKQDGTGQPAKKRKKFENILSWGDGEDDAKDDGHDQSLSEWLHDEGQNLTPTATDLGRMKQLEKSL